MIIPICLTSWKKHRIYFKIKITCTITEYDVRAKIPFNRTGYVHIAFSAGSREKVDELTKKAGLAGYEVLSGPRTTGDGYYESCIVAIENNQIEITV